MGVAHEINPALEALRDGFYIVDRDWQVRYWNAAAERLYSIARENVLGRALWEAVPAIEEADVRATLEQTMLTGVPLDHRVVHRAIGGDLSLALSVSPVPTGGVAVQVRDATEDTRLAETHLRLLETIRDGFIAVDAEWRIVYVNRRAESVLAFRKEQAIGASLWTLLPREPESLGDTLRAAIADGIPRHLEAVSPAGRIFRGRYFDVWTHPLPAGGLSILFEEVSERLAREKELARLAAEAEEASRAKSRFFAAVSHELRTPLNAIIGYTHLLQTASYGPVSDSAVRAAERAGVCAEHLAHLIDDVLLLTTTEIARLSLSTRPVDLSTFLGAVLEPHRRQAEAKGLGFTLEVPEEIATLDTDPERLRQLLHALVSNAVKFTSRGYVRIQVRELAGGEGGEEVEFTVTDTGPGVAPEHRERIFEAFEQLGDPSRPDSLSRGTGLGLTIASQIATLLRGRLVLLDSDGAGAVFALRLPRRRGG